MYTTAAEIFHFKVFPIGDMNLFRAILWRASSSSSSSSSRDEYHLGGTIALLLQDHRTMSTLYNVNKVVITSPLYYTLVTVINASMFDCFFFSRLSQVSGEITVFLELRRIAWPSCHCTEIPG